MTTTRRLQLAATAVVAVLAVLPFAVAGRISLSIFVFIGLFSLIVIGLSLLAGHAGQVSLGQAAFYGLGAYIAAISTLRIGVLPWLALPLAVSGAAGVAYLLGAPIFVLRGHVRVLGTLGVNVVMDVLVRNVQSLTGGPTGLTGIPPLSIGSLMIAGDRAYYYLTWTFVFAALWLGRNLVSSRVGRALAAVRSSEVAAATVGINPAFYKSRVFAASAALAGLAGALYVHYLSFVSPSPFAFNFSIDLLVMSVLGGIYQLPGAVAGTAILTVLREALRTIMPRVLGSGASAEYEIVLFGVLLAVVIIFSPAGVWPPLIKVLRLESARPRWAQVAPVAGVLAKSSSSLARPEPTGLLRVEGLRKQFGGLLAVDDLSFHVQAGEIYGIIGPNGAGKTTAFNLISGVLRPTRGTVYLRGRKISDLPAYRRAALGVGRTFQTPNVFPDLTVLENVMVGLHRLTTTSFTRARLGLGRREDTHAAAQAARYLAAVGLRAHGCLPAGALLHVEGLEVAYGQVQAVRGVSLAVGHHEVVAVIGANGAGKTTLLRALVRLLPSRGRIVLGGRPVARPSPEDTVRLGISLVPERRQLFGSMSVSDNLLLGAYHRIGQEPRAAIDEDQHRVLALFPALRDRAASPARTLSGGMQQMVAIGRGLMARPRLLLLDEPLLGLAPLVIADMLRAFAQILQLGQSILIVEQNAKAVLGLAARAYVLEAGRVVRHGRATTLAQDPALRAAYLGGHIEPAS